MRLPLTPTYWFVSINTLADIFKNILLPEFSYRDLLPICLSGKYDQRKLIIVGWCDSVQEGKFDK